MTRIQLEKYYPGDDAWKRFAVGAPVMDGSSDCADELASALGEDTEIATVICSLLGSESLEWVRSPKDMLDGLSPIQCMADERLRRRLRTMLMRMPY